MKKKQLLLVGAISILSMVALVSHMRNDKVNCDNVKNNLPIIETDDIINPYIKKIDPIAIQKKYLLLYEEGKCEGEHIQTEEGCLAYMKDGNIYCEEIVDHLPEELEYCSKMQYIPSQGVYTLQDETLVRYKRREKIIIPGGRLKLEGVNPDTKIAERLYYDTVYDKLYLVVLTRNNIYTGRQYYVEKEYALVSNSPGTRVFLCMFPDYNLSEVRSLGEVSSCYLTEEGMSYIDMEGIYWKYDGEQFVKMQ